MPSIQAQYNEEVFQAHREALQALRELLAAEKEPNGGARRLAIAILKARPVKDPETLTPSPRSGGEGAAGFAAADEGSPLRRRNQLQAITAILETDTTDLQRLLTTNTHPSAAAQLYTLAGADRAPHHPPSNPPQRAVA